MLSARIRLPILAMLLTLMLSATALTASPPARAATPFSILQMNLCNSGVAACYQGGTAVTEGIGIIKNVRPNIVTLNEICEPDTNRMLAELNNMGYEFAAFLAHRHDNGVPVSCTAGRGKYGVGILVRGPGSAGSGRAFGAQDSSNEERVYWCTDWTSQHICVTHLSPHSEQVAMDQCFEIMKWAIDNGVNENKATIVAGDFNLKHDPIIGQDIQDCVPGPFFRKGDGDVQHVMAHKFTFVSSHTIPMARTDHPALLVNLNKP